MLVGIVVVIEEIILAVDAEVRLTGNFEDLVVVLVDLVAAMIVLGKTKKLQQTL